MQVTRSLAAKAFQNDLSLCKETFFSSSMEDHLVLRFVHELPFLIFKHSSILHVVHNVVSDKCMILEQEFAFKR